MRVKIQPIQSSWKSSRGEMKTSYDQCLVFHEDTTPLFMLNTEVFWNEANDIYEQLNEGKTVYANLEFELTI